MSTWPELHAGTNFNYVWDTNTLAWVREDSASSGTATVKVIDGTASGQADVLGTAPGGSEQGLVVRNIPSGNHTILLARPTTANLTSASINAAGSGDNTIISATASQTSRVFKIFFVVASDVTVTLKSGTTALTGAITMKSGGSFVLDFDAEPWFVTGTNEAFIINLSGAVQTSGRIYYVKS